MMTNINCIKDERNILVMNVKSSLEEHLFLLLESLNETQSILVIELHGTTSTEKYDTLMSYLLIFYNFVGLNH